jgi:hypothetical protein
MVLGRIAVAKVKSDMKSFKYDLVGLNTGRKE